MTKQLSVLLAALGIALLAALSSAELRANGVKGHIDGQGEATPPSSGTGGQDKSPAADAPEVLAVKALLGALDETGIYSLRGELTAAVRPLPSGKLQCPKSADGLVGVIQSQIRRREYRIKWLETQAAMALGKLAPGSKLPHGARWSEPASSDQELQMRWLLLHRYGALGEKPERMLAASTKAEILREIAGLKHLAQTPAVLMKVCKEVTLACQGPSKPGSLFSIDAGSPKEPPKVELNDVRIMGGMTRRLKIPYFGARNEGGSVASSLESALKKSGRFDSLTVDLRGNYGGSFKEAAKVASLLLAALDGEGKTGRPLIIAVDARTAGAAEELIRTLKKDPRVTVVGERSYGGALAVARLGLTDGRILSVPTTRMPALCAKTVRKGAIDPDVMLPSRWDKDPSSRIGSRTSIYGLASYVPEEAGVEARTERAEKARRELERLMARDPGFKELLRHAEVARDFYAKYPAIPLDDSLFRQFRQSESELQSQWKKLEEGGRGLEEEANPFDRGLSAIASALLRK